MIQTLLDKARAKGCRVYQNSNRHWIIVCVNQEKIWSFQQHHQHFWLITFDDIYPFSLNTPATLTALDQLTKPTILTSLKH